MSKHYMKKGDGPIIQVDANLWAGYRRKGYEFSSAEDFALQQAAIKPEQKVKQKAKPAAKKKETFGRRRAT